MKFWLAPLLSAVGSFLVARFMIALGITILTFVGLDTLQEWMFTQIANNIAGLPSDIAIALIRMKIGTALSIIASAYTMRMMINAWTGVTKKLGFS